MSLRERKVGGAGHCKLIVVFRYGQIRCINGKILEISNITHFGNRKTCSCIVTFHYIELIITSCIVMESS